MEAKEEVVGRRRMSVFSAICGNAERERCHCLCKAWIEFYILLRKLGKVAQNYCVIFGYMYKKTMLGKNGTHMCHERW